MYRQSPGRNQRSKGIKVKHVLQICLLLAVCFWLIYQVKHSHDKKKEFDEKDSKITLKGGSSSEYVKLGRKDIRPRVEETTGEEVEDDRHEEEEEEEERENKVKEDKEDEGRGGGDDEMDDHDQEEDLIDDEKDREEADGNESEDKDLGENNDETERENSVEEGDGDGDEKSAHEAREVHYKADDASSAVAQDTIVVAAENENVTSENSNKQGEMDGLEKGQQNDTDRTELEPLNGGDVAKNNSESSITTDNSQQNVTNNFESGLLANGTEAEGSNDHPEMSNNSTEAIRENNDLSLNSGTQSIISHGRSIAIEHAPGESPDVQTTALEQGSNSSFSVDNSHLDSNFTKDFEDPKSKTEESSSNNTEPNASGKIFGSDASQEVGNNTGSITVNNNSTENEKSENIHVQQVSEEAGNTTVSSAVSNDNSTENEKSENIHIQQVSEEAGNTTVSSAVSNDSTEAEKIDTGDVIDDVIDSSIADASEDVQRDPIESLDSSISLEKDVRTDLDTLPELHIEGTDNEEAAAE